LIVLKQELDNHDSQTFDIEIEGQRAQVAVHKIKSAKVFHLMFKGKRRALNVTVVTDDEGGKSGLLFRKGDRKKPNLRARLLLRIFVIAGGTNNVLL